MNDAIKEGNRSDHQHEAQEHLPIPTPWVEQEQWRRHTIGAMLLAGESMVMTLKPRKHNKTLRSPQDQDHRHLRIDSSPMKFRFQRIKNEVNQSFPQEVMTKTSKVVHSEIFWTARSAKVKRS